MALKGDDALFAELINQRDRIGELSESYKTFALKVLNSRGLREGPKQEPQEDAPKPSSPPDIPES
jgi:hypothetical protein